MYLEEKRGANRKWQQEGLISLSAKQEVQHFGNCSSSFKYKYDLLLPGMGISILHKVVTGEPPVGPLLQSVGDAADHSLLLPFSHRCSLDPAG